MEDASLTLDDPLTVLNEGVCYIVAHLGLNIYLRKDSVFMIVQNVILDSKRTKYPWDLYRKFRYSGIILLGILFIFTMISCQSKILTDDETLSESDDTTQSSCVIRTDLIEYGPYIFVDGIYIRQYNMNTNLLSPSCQDPECEGSCPFEAEINQVIQVVDNKIFFYAWEAFTHNVRYGYQDLVSGDIKVLVTLSEA